MNMNVMINPVQQDSKLVELFQVEELEERLENKWSDDVYVDSTGVTIIFR